jgi:predicted nucleic acid-binding protein
VLRVLLQLPTAEGAVRHVFGARERVAAPDLLNAEVLHALRRLEARHELSADRAAEAVHDLSTLPIVRYPTIPLVERAWQLRKNFTAYDAIYVALAEALATLLVTADQHLAKAARAHTSVEVIALG